MSPDHVSRSLAYISCLSTFALFATSMSIAVVNVANLRSQPLCHHDSCVFTAVNKPAWRVLPPADSTAHMEKVAEITTGRRL
jgi:hypothetical protein